MVLGRPYGLTWWFFFSTSLFEHSSHYLALFILIQNVYSLEACAIETRRGHALAFLLLGKLFSLALAQSCDAWLPNEPEASRSDMIPRGWGAANQRSLANMPHSDRFQTMLFTPGAGFRIPAQHLSLSIIEFSIFGCAGPPDPLIHLTSRVFGPPFPSGIYGYNLIQQNQGANFKNIFCFKLMYAQIRAKNCTKLHV